MGVRIPFTKAERRYITQSGKVAYRPTNNWGSGDLPAPWAEGDIVRMVSEVEDGRLRDVRAGVGDLLVISYATSSAEGDAWYFRVGIGDGFGRNSDRLHVAYPDRSDFDRAFDFMAAFELHHTDDPDGLALREQMLGDGWTYTPPEKCPACGTTR